MECELNKPVCKRKLLMEEGPFEKKKGCPLTEPPKCPLAPPQCPLLPPPVCPVSKVCAPQGGQQCPLAEKGCPCDPNPPCPLAYDDDTKSSSKKTRKPSCPAQFPVIGGCPKTTTVRKKNIKKIPCPCPNSVVKARSKNGKRTSEKVEAHRKKAKRPPSSSSSEDSSSSSGSSSGSSSESDSDDELPGMKKRGLNVPDCTLSSSRPLPCSECLGKLLENTANSQGCKLFDKDCPYLKIMNMCEDTCLCENVPKIESGPSCPFAPKPCPCCAAVKCPMTRSPNCPIASPSPQKTVKPPSCKCHCPVVPPPCSLDIPPLCKMHNNTGDTPPCPLQPPKCKCNNKKTEQCALVPDLYTSCPVQATGQTQPCSSQSAGQTQRCSQKSAGQKQSCSSPQKKTADCEETPTLEVTPDMLNSLNDTINELNKLCTCKEPPAPQIVNMIPNFSSEKQSCEQTAGCNMNDKCPLECPSEPPRTFHVPTCPKSKPACLQTFPQTETGGEKVCPFYPKCCPLGPCCPFPVETRKKSSIPSGNRGGACGKCETGTDLKTEMGKKFSWQGEKNAQQNINNDCNAPTEASTCPLDSMAGGEKVSCPFAPAPCPLDPIKPLFKEPRTCPFAPEPTCPLETKPLCPPKPSCLIAPPEPACPYAPPTCPLAPKKLCTTEEPLNYDCPCPKPKPCCCNPCAPCPDTTLSCQCEQQMKNKCPPPEPSCGCPDLETKCPCPALQSQSSCPCPSKDNQNDCPSKKSSLKVTQDPKTSTSSKITNGSTSTAVPAGSKNGPCTQNLDKSRNNRSSKVTEGNRRLSNTKTAVATDSKNIPATQNESCNGRPPRNSESNRKVSNPITQVSPDFNGSTYPRNNEPKSGCNRCTKVTECSGSSNTKTAALSSDSKNQPSTANNQHKYGGKTSSKEAAGNRKYSNPKTNATNIKVNSITTQNEDKLSKNLSSKDSGDKRKFSNPKSAGATNSNPSTPNENSKIRKHSFSSVKRETTFPTTESNMNNEGDNNCSCKTDNYTDCSCPKEDNELFCPCGPPITKPPESSPEENIMAVVNQLKQAPTGFKCPMQIPPCEQFPEGRCPMEDLGLCDCDYPCPPCLLQPQCGSTRAPPQYCSKPDCCMGLPLPPTQQDRRDFDKDKPIYYYKLVETKPGQEETKYRVEFLDEPPVQHPFGIPGERENPNWYIVKHGSAYAKCKQLADKMKDKEPTSEAGAQFRKQDNPMDPETKLVLENRKHRGI